MDNDRRHADNRVKMTVSEPARRYLEALDSDKQALVLRTARTQADYQGIELGNRWFVSLDYETRTSSLTLDQSHQSDDGAYYFVISSKDPGIQNWLDTEAHSNGLIMLRWQGPGEKISEADYPSVRLVNFEDLTAELPQGTPAFSRTERRQQILERRVAISRRYR